MRRQKQERNRTQTSNNFHCQATSRHRNALKGCNLADFKHIEASKIKKANIKICGVSRLFQAQMLRKNTAKISSQRFFCRLYIHC